MTTTAILSDKCERRISDSSSGPTKEVKSVKGKSSSLNCTIRSLLRAPSIHSAPVPPIDGDWSSPLDVMEQLSLVEALVRDDATTERRTSEVMTYQEDTTWDDFCEDLPLEEK